MSSRYSASLASAYTQINIIYILVCLLSNAVPSEIQYLIRRAYSWVAFTVRNHCLGYFSAAILT
jgi:hypothetical protein